MPPLPPLPRPKHCRFNASVILTVSRYLVLLSGRLSPVTSPPIMYVSLSLTTLLKWGPHASVCSLTTDDIEELQQTWESVVLWASVALRVARKVTSPPIFIELIFSIVFLAYKSGNRDYRIMTCRWRIV